MSRRRRILPLVVVVLVAGACAGSGGGEAAPTPGEDIDASAALAFVEETSGAEGTGEPDVILAGVAELEVRPGETVVVDHLAYNSAPITRSVRFDVPATNGLEATVSRRSVRLSPSEPLGLDVTVVVDDDVEPGERLTYRLRAATPGTPAAESAVELVVSEDDGDRPVLVDAEAATSPNEKVSVYVVGTATDSDADLDYASLEVASPGFRAHEVTAANGTLTYHPFENLTGPDMVLFSLCDRVGLCDTATVMIEVVDS